VGRYFSFGIWSLIIWLAFGAWCLRRKGSRPGPAAGAMMDQLMDDQRRAAIEVVLEERAAERDPEDRDGNLPDLAGHLAPIRHISARVVADGGSIGPALLEIGVMCLLAGRTEAVRELRVRSLRNVFLQPLPFAGVVPDALAERADRKQSFERLDVAI